MRLCESMRSWRHQGSAGAFRAAVGVLLLGLSMAQSVCPIAEVPPDIIQPEYQEYGNIADGFLAVLVQPFLGIVQLNPFPADLILTIIDLNRVNDVDAQVHTIIREALQYEVGFLVCAVFGVLFILLMPIVGYFLACCRCCGLCGGKMYQKQTRSINCRRRALYWSAFITTGLILAGNVCMFKSNQDLNQSVNQFPAEFNKSVDNIDIFFTDLPKQTNTVAKEGYATTEMIESNINDTGTKLGGAIQARFQVTLDPALQSVTDLDKGTEDINDQIKKLNSSLVQLKSDMDGLQENFTAIQERINKTFNDKNCNGCQKFTDEINDLTLDISIPFGSLNNLQSAVDEVVAANLSSTFQNETEEYLNSIPETVTKETKEIVQETLVQLEEIKRQISKVNNELNSSALTEVKDFLNSLQGEISNRTPDVKEIEHIRWGVSVALSCLVLLVVACNVMGLILGPLGLKSNADPTKRSSTASCGGTFFMAGAGFSFIFSWLLMIVVLALFLLGGNTYMLLCKPWDDGELLKFIDTPGLIPELNISESLGLKTDIGVSDVYNDCKKNQTVWTTFHLNEVIDLDELFNVSTIEQNLDSISFGLPTIALLTEDVMYKLGNFSMNIDDFNTTDLTQQINNTYSINLNDTADTIDDLIGVQDNITIIEELKTQSSDLRSLQSKIEITIHPQLGHLTTLIKSLEEAVMGVNRTVGNVLTDADKAQNTNLTEIVETESRGFVDCQLGYLNNYTDWIKVTVTNDLGRCGPVVESVDSFEFLLCSNMVQSVNGFWFSLGWCLFFFIPSIIFSIKLAKYYRRMKFSDVYDDLIIMNHIPRAQAKIA